MKTEAWSESCCLLTIRTLLGLYNKHMSDREKNLNAEEGHITPYPTPAAATDGLEMKSIWLHITSENFAFVTYSCDRLSVLETF